MQLKGNRSGNAAEHHSSIEGSKNTVYLKLLSLIFQIYFFFPRLLFPGVVLQEKNGSGRSIGYT